MFHLFIIHKNWFEYKFKFMPINQNTKSNFPTSDFQSYLYLILLHLIFIKFYYFLFYMCCIKYFSKLQVDQANEYIENRWLVALEKTKTREKSLNAINFCYTSNTLVIIKEIKNGMYCESLHLEVFRGRAHTLN